MTRKIVSKRQVFKAFMPAFKCDEDQYKAIEKIAKESGVSKAEVLRQAVEFFLLDMSHKTQQSTVKRDIQPKEGAA